MLDKSKDNPQIVRDLRAKLAARHAAWQDKIDRHKIFKLAPAAPGKKKSRHPRHPRLETPPRIFP